MKKTILSVLLIVELVFSCRKDDIELEDQTIEDNKKPLTETITLEV